MRNAGLEEAQTGIKIAGRNINNLRHADDTTLMAENEELKSLLMKVKGVGEDSEVPWTARRSKQSILKEISPGCSLEGLMLKLKLPILWPPDAKSQLVTKDPDAGKD